MNAVALQSPGCLRLGPACSITASIYVNAVTLQWADCSVTASLGFVGQPRPASHILHAPECERVLTGRGPPAHLPRGGGSPRVPPPRAACRPVDLPAGPPKNRQDDPFVRHQGRAGVDA